MYIYGRGDFFKSLISTLQKGVETCNLYWKIDNFKVHAVMQSVYASRGIGNVSCSHVVGIHFHGKILKQPET